MGTVPTISWETLDGGQTYRAEVIGGWLIRYDLYSHRSYTDDRGVVYGQDPIYESQMVFVPDPMHLWDAQNTLLNLIKKDTPT